MLKLNGPNYYKLSSVNMIPIGIVFLEPPSTTHIGHEAEVPVESPDGRQHGHLS